MFDQEERGNFSIDRNASKSKKIVDPEELSVSITPERSRFSCPGNMLDQNRLFKPMSPDEKRRILEGGNAMV